MFRINPRRSEGNSGGGRKRTPKKTRAQSEPGATTAKPNRKNGGFAAPPVELKKLRACMICSLIKGEGEFEEDGCDNCETFLQLVGTRGAHTSYTSGNFEGMIAMIAPEQSWVARWQRIVSLKPGLYAVNVRGEVDRWVKAELEDAGLPYQCRDRSKLFAKADEKRRNQRADVDSDEENEENDVEEVESRGSDEVVVDNVEMPTLDVEDENSRHESDENQNTTGTSNAAEASSLDETRSTVSTGMPYRSGRRFSSDSSSSSD